MNAEQNNELKRITADIAEIYKELESINKALLSLKETNEVTFRKKEKHQCTFSEPGAVALLKGMMIKRLKEQQTSSLNRLHLLSKELSNWTKI